MLFLLEGDLSLAGPVPSTHGKKIGRKDGGGGFRVAGGFPGGLNVESQEEVTLCFTNGGECAFL